LRNGSPIGGATARAYTLTPADLGALITAEVTGSLNGYNSVVKISSSVTVGAGALALTPTPSISGTASVGLVLTAAEGSWDSGVGFAYRWLRNGSPIGGATARAYTLTPADLGALITAEVTGSLNGYNSVSRTSASVTVSAGTLSSVKSPAISGTAKVGKTLVITSDAISGAVKSYLWFRNGVAISGAKASKYKLTAKDAKKSITCQVIYSKAGYLQKSVKSASKKVS
jgi:hypothetical protein